MYESEIRIGDTREIVVFLTRLHVMKSQDQELSVFEYFQLL